MKYQITFQALAKGASRPTDHASASDFSTETEQLALIPSVGDLVHIEPMSKPNAPRYSGRVKSRLFSYFGDENCSINIVVEDIDEPEAWALAIKE
jgi:hypothetical protein